MPHPCHIVSDSSERFRLPFIRVPVRFLVNVPGHAPRDGMTNGMTFFFALTFHIGLGNGHIGSKVPHRELSGLSKNPFFDRPGKTAQMQGLRNPEV